MLPRIHAAALLCLAAMIANRAVNAADWLPISADELKMTAEPLAPGAPAIYLYRQVDRSDNDSEEWTYVRIKVLTEEGRKYGDVEIPFIKDRESISRIEARTVRPDGSIVEFQGKVFEKPIVQSTGVKVIAKTFTLPAVEPGAIIEYRYERRLPLGWVFDSHWILSQDLFTSHAKFSLEPSRYFSLRWSWPMGVPPGSDVPKVAHGRISLEVRNVPAFVTEEFMPPADNLKYRVDFIYDTSGVSGNDPVAFWRSYGKKEYAEVERFADRRRAMLKALEQIVLPADDAETKLRKIYARVGQIRNLSYESAAEREAQHQDPSAIHNVEDVWSHGYGDGRQVTWLFLALVRAAGFQADAVLESTRDEYFFSEKLMNPYQLNSNLVVVTVDGRDLYLDPGVPFTPFGLLPWSETGVRALRLAKGGGEWIDTPMPSSSTSLIERKASLKLEQGSLDGKLTVEYTGLEASWRRLQERDEDDTAKRQFLEDTVEGDIPTGVNVKLTNSPDWNGWDTPLVAEFDLEVPGWMTSAGRHGLLPVGLFGSAEKHVFEHAERVQPMYFDFPYRHHDDVTIELPAGWRASSVPKGRSIDLKALAYASTSQASGTTLHLTRDLTLNAILIGAKDYDAVRKFFEMVRTGDEDQVVVSPAAAFQAR